MIWRTAASVAAGAAIACAVGIALQAREVAALRAENAMLAVQAAARKVEAEQSRLAREIAERQRAEAQARAREFQRAAEALLTGDIENADLELDPRIGAWLECLRRGAADCDRIAPDSAGAGGAGADQ